MSTKDNLQEYSRESKRTEEKSSQCNCITSLGEAKISVELFVPSIHCRKNSGKFPVVLESKKRAIKEEELSITVTRWRKCDSNRKHCEE